MKCYNVRPHLEKMAAGEIDGILLRWLEGHLQNCPGCREEYREMKEALKIWQQTPRLEPAPQFSPAWRQRIRQDAFEREAGRRCFFSVFKANTLIPALGVLVVLIVFGVFNIFNRFTSKAAIDPLITRYNPALSSTIGIPLIIKFFDVQPPENIVYRWSTEYGRFLNGDGIVTELGPEVRTQAEKVYWSAAVEEEFEGPSFTISVRVEDLKTGKLISRAELRMERDGEGYYVAVE